MKKIIIVFGTRPEALKTAILIKLLKNEFKAYFNTVIINTGQHDSMLQQVLNYFQIIPDYNLEIMKFDQNLSELTARIIIKLDEIIKIEKPDLLMVQGDTTSAFAASLVAFYNKIKIAHIEAGLRTNQKFQPFPEEINRKFIDTLADFYFAPTELNYQNLIKEQIPAKNIYITGNTIVDALLYIKNNKPILNEYFDKKIVLITAHRRENFGKPIINICDAISYLADKFKEYIFIYPVHKNPNIHKVVTTRLSNIENVKLLEPLDYFSFISILKEASLVITDSGGVQEEAVTLNIPTLVIRNYTERKEGVVANILKVIGAEKENIINNTTFFLERNSTENKAVKTVYGSGNSSRKILNILRKEL